jgi:hypothetical protein
VRGGWSEIEQRRRGARVELNASGGRAWPRLWAAL